MSRLPRVGLDVDAGSYWSERAGAYSARIDGPYHAHRLEVVEAVVGDVDLDGARCVDFGCGDGVFAERLASRGARVLGVDPVPELVDEARARLAASGVEAEIVLGAIDALAAVESGSVDLFVALNVVAYMADDEEKRLYSEIARLLRDGGSFVVTHSNELFDLYSLNRYTADFFERHFGVDAAQLLRHPERPERVTFNVRENPLTYRMKLASYGLEEVRQEFVNFHEAPPLLMDPKGFEDIDARSYAQTLDVAEGERWKLLFRCSQFASRSVRRRVGEPR